MPVINAQSCYTFQIFYFMMLRYASPTVKLCSLFNQIRCNSKIVTPLQAYQRNIESVRLMERHVLTAACVATGKDKYRNGVLWKAYAKRSIELKTLLTYKDIALILSSFSAVNRVDDELLHEFSEILISLDKAKYSKMTPYNLFTIITSFASLNYSANPELFKKLSKICTSMDANLFSSKDLSGIANSFARMKIPSTQLFRWIVNGANSKMDPGSEAEFKNNHKSKLMSLRDVSIIANACSRVNCLQTSPGKQFLTYAENQFFQNIEAYNNNHTIESSLNLPLDADPRDIAMLIHAMAGEKWTIKSQKHIDNLRKYLSQIPLSTDSKTLAALTGALFRINLHVEFYEELIVLCEEIARNLSVLDAQSFIYFMQTVSSLMSLSPSASRLTRAGISMYPSVVSSCSDSQLCVLCVSLVKFAPTEAWMLEGTSLSRKKEEMDPKIHEALLAVLGTIPSKAPTMSIMHLAILLSSLSRFPTPEATSTASHHVWLNLLTRIKNESLCLSATSQDPSQQLKSSSALSLQHAVDLVGGMSRLRLRDPSVLSHIVSSLIVSPLCEPGEDGAAYWSAFLLSLGKLRAGLNLTNELKVPLSSIMHQTLKEVLLAEDKINVRSGCSALLGLAMIEMDSPGLIHQQEELISKVDYLYKMIHEQFDCEPILETRSEHQQKSKLIDEFSSICHMILAVRSAARILNVTSEIPLPFSVARGVQANKQMFESSANHTYGTSGLHRSIGTALNNLVSNRLRFVNSVTGEILTVNSVSSELSACNGAYSMDFKIILTMDEDKDKQIAIGVEGDGPFHFFRRIRSSQSDVLETGEAVLKRIALENEGLKIIHIRHDIWAKGNETELLKALIKEKGWEVIKE